VKEYITHYEKTWDKLMEYQDRYPLQEYAERSVLTTWKMSYEQVRTMKPEAARLLDQWAFLHPGDMSYELLENYIRSSEGSEEARGCESIAEDVLSFKDSVGVLAQYSLVNKTEGMSSFSIHAVVHEWSLYNIVDDRAREQLCVRAIRMVAKSVPTTKDAGDLQAARKLLLHTRMAARRHVKMREVANLQLELHRVAYFMSDWESSQEVVSLYLRALRGKEEAWGAKHTSTLHTLNNLGNLYADQGKMKEAEEMLLQALRGFEEAWGAKHTSTLDTVNNLGLLYWKQGKMKEAEEMLLRALRGKEEAWGAKHTSTLHTLNNLGLLYADQGKMKEAEEMLLRVLRGKEEVWGAKHTSTLNTVNNLGPLYADQGKMKEAEEMLLRALKGFEEAWGAKHTSTLDTVNNLGRLYADQGRMKEAEEMLLRALKGYEEAWGPEHVSTLDTVYGLGNLCRDQGEVAKAKEMYERAAEGYEDVEVDREAHIVYIRNQLSLLVATDGEAERGCQPIG
jgi:tetratricopeptide (TPR) repeat protein